MKKTRSKKPHDTVPLNLDLQNKEVKDQSSDLNWHIVMLRRRRGAGIHVLYTDRSLKRLGVCMVSAEILN